MAGAFADDIGVVIADIRSTAPALAKLFEWFGRLSNLWLHPMKSVLVPLMPGVSLDAFRSELAAIVPSWSTFSVTLVADYLGFKLGPDAHLTFWNSALKKANDTMRRWKAIHAGFFFNILAANVFILPLFSYLAQLADVSDIFYEVNQSMRSILFGGPGHWMPAGFLTSLKQIGFPAELHDFENHANAARIRTAQRVLPLLDDETRVEISRAMICFRVNNGADHPHWKWHETCYLTSITAAKEIFESDDPAHLALLCEDTKKKCLKLQSKITALLNAKSQHCTAKLWAKLRSRLLRWRFTIPIGIIEARVRRRLLLLEGKVRPGMFIAYWKLLTNSWNTGRRFRALHGHSRRCIFCKQGDDSIEHFAKCPIIVHIFNSHFCTCNNIVEFFALDKACFELVACFIRKVKLLAGVYAAHSSLFVSSSNTQIMTSLRSAVCIALN